jgi:diguanylate cyclase (GGDEF)-like protein
MIGASMNRGKRDAGGMGARSVLLARFGRRRRSVLPSTPLRVWVLIAGMALLVGLAWAAAIDRLPEGGIHHPLPWPGVAAAMVGASLLTVAFMVRGQNLNVVPSEIPLVVGVIFLSPVHLLLAAVVAELALGVSKRRPPAVALFNVLSFASAAVASLACYHWILDGSSPVSLRGWAAAAVAVIVADLVMLVAVQTVVAVSAWRWPRAEALAALRASVMVSPIAVVLVLTAVHAVWANRLAALLFVVLGVMALLGQRSSTELRRRYANLERLYRFAERTSGVSEVDDVVLSILRHAREVMGAGAAELVLPDRNACLCYSLDPDDRIVSAVHAEPSGLERLVQASGVGMLASYDDHRAEVGQALAERGLRYALAAPITFGDDLRGVIIVGHSQGSATFDNEDLRLFEVLASHSGVAIQGGRLLDRLRREVKAREHEALHDSLTGLANRNLFERFLARALEDRTVGRLVAVMLMDLDGFKEINDTMGHHVGDAVLKELAARLTASISEHGLVARLGGDEFAFVLPDLPNAERVGELGRVILSELERPVGVEGLALEVRASLGVSLAPEHGEERSQLLRRADVAMYTAKSAGGGIEVYDPSDDRHSTRRLILAHELRAAPRTDAIEVWYQPVADLASGAVLGCEALLRWNHSLHGPIPPDEFIPLAEQSGIIRELTWWVLDAAIRQARVWHERGQNLGISVNMAARTLLEADLLDRLAHMLSTTGVEPHRLTLELTESSIMADPIRSEKVLASLGELGVGVALDDFGTGYSSLSRLKELPIHVVKIDKSFVISMSVDEGDLAIVRSTIELARNLGHIVVAEGVENQVTWDQLVELGCDQAQGFYLARPMPATTFDLWLRQRRRGHLSVVPPAEEMFGA